MVQGESEGLDAWLNNVGPQACNTLTCFGCWAGEPPSPLRMVAGREDTASAWAGCRVTALPHEPLGLVRVRAWVAEASEGCLLPAGPLQHTPDGDAPCSASLAAQLMLCGLPHLPAGAMLYPAALHTGAHTGLHYPYYHGLLMLYPAGHIQAPTTHITMGY